MTAGGLAMWMMGEVHLVSWPQRQLSIVARGLGLLVLALTAHLASIRFIWGTSNKIGFPTIWAFVFMLLTAIGALIVYRNKSHTRRFALAGILIAGGLLCGSALAAIYADAEQSMLFVFANNLAALALGTVAIRISLADEKRGLFWAGSLYVVILVFARFLEYETSLLLKSLVFIACGVAVIVDEPRRQVDGVEDRVVRGDQCEPEGHFEERDDLHRASSAVHRRSSLHCRLRGR